MTDKDFEIWWEKEGYNMHSVMGLDFRRIAGIAWGNGAFKAKEEASRQCIVYLRQQIEEVRRMIRRHEKALQEKEDD